MVDLTVLQQLGITKEDVISRLVDRLAEDFSDPEKMIEVVHSEFRDNADKKLKEAITAKFDAAMADIASTISDHTVSSMVWQATDRWGEPTGDALGLREFFFRRIDAWLREEVDKDGKTRKEVYNFQSHGMRVEYLVWSRAKEMVTKAVSDSLKGIEVSIGKTLSQAVVEAFQDRIARLKVG